MKEHELERIKAAISECLQGTNYEPPKLTFIVVSKRISARFFHPANNKILNPPSGTVVDDVVTLPERYDFYLISQVTHNNQLILTNLNHSNDIVMNIKHLNITF